MYWRDKQFQLTRSRGAWPVEINARTNYFAFQLTRSRGAWHDEKAVIDEFEDFNSHAHVERDIVKSNKGGKLIKFQLTRSRGAWRMSLAKTADDLTFQLTRSRGAWLVLQLVLITKKHFNSHAHVERDFTRFNEVSALVISTHTLTWSVTGSRHGQDMNFSFQLTRSRGAWHFNGIYGKGTENFNSHAHVERDQTKTENLDLKNNFNSHAHVERDRSFKHR